MVDVLSFLRSRGIETATFGGTRRDKHIGQGWVQMRCPICGGDKLWLGYNVAHGFFNCFCHGFARKSELFKAWFPDEETRSLLAIIDNQHVTRSQEKVVSSGEYLPPLPQKRLIDSTPQFFQYVKGRGLDFECLSRWGVTALDWDAEWQYRGRLFFPVCNREAKPVSWLTRTIDSDNPYRYLAAPKDRESFPIKSLLYGEQFVSPFDTVVVVEGVFDALRIGRNAVATFGKKITTSQFDKIARFQRRILCFDAERETQEQAKELAVKLSAFPGLTDNVCLDAPDPATASQKEINALLNFAELL